MGSTPIMDTGPVNVRGLIKARYARVVWADGTLHVVTKLGSKFVHQSIPTTKPEQPDRVNGWWRAQAEDGSVSFSGQGCQTCGGRYRPFLQLSQDDILNGNV